jgi:hypothetical protein
MFRRRSAPFKFDEAYRMRHNPTPAENIHYLTYVNENTLVFEKGEKGIC